MQENTKEFKTNHKTLRKNVIINFIGQSIVGLSAIIIIPPLVRLMGYTSYGLLSLALTVFGSFSLLELGLGRATTKFVAEYLREKKYEKIGPVIWTSLVMQILIGVVAGLVFLTFIPSIISKLTFQDAALQQDARTVLFYIAISIPLILGSASLRGALEGAQRFDLVNYIKITLNLSNYIVPLIGAKFHLPVSQIVLILLVVRFCGTVFYLNSCIYTIPKMKKVIFLDKSGLKTLFSFAGWVAISNLIVPFIVQIDRYFIASLISISAVTFYSVPFELLNGLWIIPGSIAAVLFPAFSAIKETDSNFIELFNRPIKYILLILGPIILLVAVYSHELLQMWQGLEMADHSSIVLKILVMGVLINSLGWVPSNLISGSGRPDLIAKLHIFQLLIYFVILYFFIKVWGILGAAMAFTLRVTIEAVISFVLSFQLYPSLTKVFFLRIYRCSLFYASLCILVILNYLLNSNNLLINLVSLASILCSFLLLTWKYLLDENDKKVLPFLK